MTNPYESKLKMVVISVQGMTKVKHNYAVRGHPEHKEVPSCNCGISWNPIEKEELKYFHRCISIIFYSVLDRNGKILISLSFLNSTWYAFVVITLTTGLVHEGKILSPSNTWYALNIVQCEDNINVWYSY